MDGAVKGTVCWLKGSNPCFVGTFAAVNQKGTSTNLGLET